MSEQSEKIYINLVKNKDWKSPTDKLPVYVGPKNMKHPDKNWTIGVNINGKWYNQAAFPSKDQDGNVKEGELTVILTQVEQVKIALQKQMMVVITNIPFNLG